MDRLVAQNPKNAEIIQPFLGGEELNTSPTLSHHRYVINFRDMSIEEARSWPDLLRIIEERVKPQRMQVKRKALRERWWQFAEKQPALHDAIDEMNRVLVVAQTSKTQAFAFKETGSIFSHKVIVFALDSWQAFAVLQSRCHQEWTRFLGSTMKDDAVYTPSDCFETSPFPLSQESHPLLDARGQEYYEFRADLMVRKNEGLTVTYNRFHDPVETSLDIIKMRELHDAMDRVVLEAYGWGDVRSVCGFGLDYLDVEDENMPEEVPSELWWPTAEEHKEAVLRSVIRRHLPSSMAMGTGFVVAHDDVSTQIDILIIDGRSPVLFREGDLMIVTPDAVRAAIEVKTRLQGAQYEEALEKLGRIKAMCNRFVSDEVWTGLFVYEGDRVSDTTVLQSLARSGRDTQSYVDCVSCGSSFFVRYPHT